MLYESMLHILRQGKLIISAASEYRALVHGQEWLCLSSTLLMFDV